ncbi:helix-turn-helix domain-containing protein [Bdellovibrio bacteriovorus]|uniref:winged helix-turn-helix domain-containing protein n=1 Tax=Bdellovibrio bacteriovorus TaxID=959 RepID=UPI0021CFF368|nr:helix-turn-helix domain-containing protein [Bdellovibrio bacteriovorus]UXR63821.1 helix-turn-helix domain-containing protein [Bdellovibrio bacteriovorus]
MTIATLNPSLQIARLQHRQGDLHEARHACEEAMVVAKNQKNNSDWIEAARLFFQCCHELETLDEVKSVMEQVMAFHHSTQLPNEQSRAENLIGAWLLANNKVQESEMYIHSSIAKATQTHDLETLARALFTLALGKAFNSETYGQCLQQLDKLDIILTELSSPEIQLSTNQLRGFIYSQTRSFDRALELLWDSYEKAKAHGFILLISSILAQMARVHRDQGHTEQHRIYAELALRGISQERAPRIYRLISSLCPEGIKTQETKFDFVIDEAARVVREKQKGAIDFKNQHILYDLALLFIKNAGQRYSKEDLVETIWHQPYDPELHDNLIYVSIKRLRTLLEPDLESPRYILRDRKGYYFNPQSHIQFKNVEEMTT